jgi:hypothetical protein
VCACDDLFCIQACCLVETKKLVDRVHGAGCVYISCHQLAYRCASGLQTISLVTDDTHTPLRRQQLVDTHNAMMLLLPSGGGGGGGGCRRLRRRTSAAAAAVATVLLLTAATSLVQAQPTTGGIGGSPMPPDPPSAFQKQDPPPVVVAPATDPVIVAPAQQPALPADDAPIVPAPVPPPPMPTPEEEAEVDALTLANTLGSYMVLQQGPMPACLYGTGTPLARIEVAIEGNAVSSTQTVVDPVGNWVACLPPQPAGGPHTVRAVPRVMYTSTAVVPIGSRQLIDGWLIAPLAVIIHPSAPVMVSFRD